MKYPLAGNGFRALTPSGSQSERVAKKISRFFWTVWCVFLAALILSDMPSLVRLFESQGPFKSLFILYAAGTAAVFWLYSRLSRRLTTGKMAFALFLGALVVRFVVVLLGHYVPTNDFKNYFDLGRYFASGNYGEIARLTDSYGLPKLAGNGVYYGLLFSIFSPTLLGAQIINCIATSLICMQIYQIAVKVPYAQRAAVFAAVLYLCYPANILSTQITTNHHGATLFLLAAMRLFYALLECDFQARKAHFITLLMLTALTLVISDFLHPSAILVLCAMAAFAGVWILSHLLCLKRDFKPGLKRIAHGAVSLAAVCVLYFAFTKAGVAAITAVGMFHQGEEHSVLAKIVVGLNQETMGQWSADYAKVREAGDQKAQRRYCLQVIRERTSDPAALLNLIWQKNLAGWLGVDNYFYFYTDGITAELDGIAQESEDPVIDRWAEQTKQDVIVWRDAWSIVDIVYVRVLWVGAVLGLCVVIRKRMTIFDLLIWFPAGWMAFMSITELQARYRYQSMPIICLLAGLGLQAAAGYLSDRYRARRSKTREYHKTGNEAFDQ